MQSTKKITSAMKMVSASKLRRAQEAVAAARPYAERMGRIVNNLTASLSQQERANRLLTGKLLTGNGRADRHLIIPVTANRGLCGAFNSAVVRESRGLIADLSVREKDVILFCIGYKGSVQFKKDYRESVISVVDDIDNPFDVSVSIGRRIVSLFEAGTFDVCTMVFNRFQSAVSQVVTRQQLIPIPIVEQLAHERSVSASGAWALYEYEPSEEAILETLAQRNVTVQIFRALLESVASEHGARMTAMDNATRNANDMLNDLTLSYNRTRQAYITKELIEIISGAEALS